MTVDYTVDSFLALRTAYEILGKTVERGPEQARHFEDLESKVFACARHLADNKTDLNTMVWLCRKVMMGNARTQVNPEKLIEYLNYAEETGHNEGIRLLAKYHFGWDRIFSPGQINQTKAMKLFERAAKMGDAESRYELAVALLENQSTEKDIKRARSMLQALMCEAYPPAFFTYYTRFYLMHDSAEENKPKNGYDILEQGLKAVEDYPSQDDAEWVGERLSYFAGLSHAEGHGCEKDIEKAIHFMKKSAELNPGGDAFLWLYNKGLDRLIETLPKAFYPANPIPPQIFSQAEEAHVYYEDADDENPEADPTCIVLEKPLTFIKFKENKNAGSEKQAANSETELTKDNLDEILKPFDSLIGLDNVREQIKSLFYLMLADSRRRKSGVGSGDYRPALHMVFSGNPGTGKTTVARMTGEILKKLGYLKRGHVVEVDRSKLIGEYIGQSEHITAEILKRARDGVLFIDEAYDLEVPDSYRDYGSRIITMIMKAMEDQRHNMVVIFAGFKDEMKWFIQSNAGLSSRIGAYIDFPDYADEELADIFEVFCKNHGYQVAAETKEKVVGILKTMESGRKDKFGNARGTRNLFDETVRNQSRRIIERNIFEGPDLMLVLPEDVPGTYVPGSTGGKIAKFPPRK